MGQLSPSEVLEVLEVLAVLNGEGSLPRAP